MKERFPLRSVKSVLWNNPFLHYPYVLLSLVNYKDDRLVAGQEVGRESQT